MIQHQIVMALQKGFALPCQDPSLQDLYAITLLTCGYVVATASRLMCIRLCFEEFKASRYLTAPPRPLDCTVLQWGLPNLHC